MTAPNASFRSATNRVVKSYNPDKGRLLLASKTIPDVKPMLYPAATSGCSASTASGCTSLASIARGGCIGVTFAFTFRTKCLIQLEPKLPQRGEHLASATLNFLLTFRKGHSAENI